MTIRELQFAVLLMCVGSFSQAEAQPVQQFQPLKGISIRALEVVSDSVVWFAADRGVWGYTLNAGGTWHVDSVRVDTVYPQFRSISVLNDSTVLLLSIASPAYLMRTTDKGRVWNVVYRNARPDVFFDSMAFSDSLHGYAVSDPIDGRFLMISTTDGGRNWREMDTRHWPVPADGEAFYASSNANISLTGGHLFICTGGARTRLLHTDALGKTCNATDLPLPQGGKMTGAYAMHFITPELGAMAGGDYERTAPDVPALAVTTDGGHTWQQLAASRPFFGSSVRFRNSDELYVTGHDGTFQFLLPTKKSKELTTATGEPLKFHTLRIAPSGKTLWLAGKDGRVAKVILD